MIARVVVLEVFGCGFAVFWVWFGLWVFGDCSGCFLVLRLFVVV